MNQKYEYKYESIPDNYSCFISEDPNLYPHAHNHLELIYVIDGMVNMILGESEKQMYHGDITLILPNQIHYIETPVHSRILCFLFRTEFIGDLQQITSNHMLMHSALNISCLSSLSSSILQELIRIKEKNNDRAESHDYFCYHEFLGMAICLVSDFLSHSQLIRLPDSSSQIASQLILQYLEQHFTEKLTLDTLSNAIGISKSHICRIFANELHITFSDFITQRRMYYAKYMLVNTDLSVSEIIFASGFNSERTFYRCFHKMYRLTPKQYRASLHAEI